MHAHRTTNGARRAWHCWIFLAWLVAPWVVLFATSGCDVPKGERHDRAWAAGQEHPSAAELPAETPLTSAGTSPDATPTSAGAAVAPGAPSSSPAQPGKDPSGRPAAAPSDGALDETKNVRSLSVREQQESLLASLSEQGHAAAAALEQLRVIFAASEWLSYGNPKVSRPPMTREECRARRRNARVVAGEPSCGAPNMVPIYDARSQTAANARTCIDQYEFPNLECEYPVVWVRSSEAAQICAALGKRLCDAHEWEGACAGSVLGVDEEYPWATMPKSVQRSDRRQRRLWLEYEHNRTREVRWAYGATRDHPRCATGAGKDERCTVVDFGTCGSNTYPAGAFPQCVSPFGVYDQHGNAAEHMNLALQPDELASRGGLGWTEMKGSWFVFQAKETHPDDCRWRAKSWHTTKIADKNSHRNYHLGFRCCKDVAGGPARPPE